MNGISQNAISVQAPSPQLALPTGPVTLLQGGRRDRTDEDRDFLSEAFKVKAGGAAATALYRCLAYYASLTERRIAYPSQSTMATYCDMSVRQVRRVLSKLQNNGLIACLNRKQGACSSTYELSLIGHDVPFKSDMIACVNREQTSGAKSIDPGETEGPKKESFQFGLLFQEQNELYRMGHDVPFEWDIVSPNKEREGKDQRTKITSSTSGAKSIDPGETEGPKKEVVHTSFPSQEQEKENAPVPKAPEPVFEHPQQVALLFKLQRKLGYPADDEQAAVFDGFDHGHKKRILDKLLAEEQLAAVRGEVEAPPPKPRAPRAGAPISTAPKRAEPSPCVSGHRWTEAASDGVRNCVRCLAESPGGEGFEAIKEPTH